MVRTRSPKIIDTGFILIEILAESPLGVRVLRENYYKQKRADYQAVIAYP
jgi:hypothetical protein